MNVTLRAAVPAAAIVLGLLLTSAAEAKSHNVTICHKGQEISISENAVDAHLRNHEADNLGPCEEAAVCPCWTAEQVHAALANAVANDFRTFCGAGGIFRDPEDGEFELFAEFAVSDMASDTFGDVDYFAEEDDVFSECEVFVEGDGAGAGIDPIEVEDISLDEAVACRQAIVDACPVLLP